jgi:metacaspase-1
MKILCIHGISHIEARDGWRNDWENSIKEAIKIGGSIEPLEISQFAYDDFFASADSSSSTYLKALTKLLKSWIFSSGERDLFGLFDKYRWTVGMVAQFVALSELRTTLRNALAAEVLKIKPDLIIAHSLGGLIAYDTFSSNLTLPRLNDFNGQLVTLGTQIGHPAVAEVFAGRINYPSNLSRWWNLHNDFDVVFTRSISLPGESRYKEIVTNFEFGGINHDADRYISNEQASVECWRDLISNQRATGVRGITLASKKSGNTKQSKNQSSVQDFAKSQNLLTNERPKMRALLVGIAEYADPSFSLEGPVNDVFLVSQTLQEMGVEADAIRVTLNDRATAAGIRERLRWLLADARDGDTMFFYFSGHGAQVPAYGRDAEVDHIDECLVPYDFNWQSGNAIFDDEFAALYSQLPYKSKLVAMFDCCHAGGMQRGSSLASGRSQGARSIGMPDDIRHRALRWDRPSQMWLPRTSLLAAGAKLKEEMIQQESKGASKLKLSGATKKIEGRVGNDGTLRRIGRAQTLRGTVPADYESRRKEYGHKGPYMPILLEACAENQSAYEYQHGSVTYGAFTYALCEHLNRLSKQKKKTASISFAQLIKATAERIQPVASGPQTPQLVCAAIHRNESVFE